MTDDYGHETCDRCEEYEDDCICRECSDCGIMVDSVCEDHDRCNDCSENVGCCDYRPRCDACDECLDNCICFECDYCGHRQLEPTCEHDLCESCQATGCHCCIPYELRTPDGL